MPTNLGTPKNGDIPVLTKKNDPYEAMIGINDSVSKLHKSLLVEIEKLKTVQTDNLKTNEEQVQKAKDSEEIQKKESKKARDEKVKSKREQDKKETKEKGKKDSFFSLIGEKLKGTFSKSVEVFESEGVTRSALGIGNLIVEPIKELKDDPIFKKFGDIFKRGKEKLTDFFQKRKEKPDENKFKLPFLPGDKKEDLLKLPGKKGKNQIEIEDFKKGLTDNNIKKRDPGIFWFWKKTQKKKEEEEDSDLIGKLLGGGGILSSLLGGKMAVGKGGLTKAIPMFLQKVMKGILKALPILAIVTGIIMGIVDGIKATFKSGEWKVSKLSAFIGGFLGGSDKGIKGAFKNMGKWALIGAGIGTLVMPVVGTIAGGLIGAAIGGILGYIGGEKISKGVNKLQGFIEKFFDIKKFFLFFAQPIINITDAIKNMFTDITKIWGNKEESLGTRVGKIVGTILTTILKILKNSGEFILKMIFGLPIALFKSFKTKGIKEMIGKLKLSVLLPKIGKGILTFLYDFFVKGFFPIFGKKLIDGIKKVFSGTVNILKDIVEAVTGIVSGLFQGAMDLGEGAKDLVSGIIEKVKKIVGDMLTKGLELIKDPKKIMELVSSIFESIGNFLSNIFENLKLLFTDPKTLFQNIFSIFDKKEEVDKTGVKSINEKNDGMFKKFKDFFSGGKEESSQNNKQTNMTVINRDEYDVSNNRKPLQPSPSWGGF